MTTTIDKPLVVAREELVLIDQFLSGINHQTIVPQADVLDFVLDLRIILSKTKE